MKHRYWNSYIGKSSSIIVEDASKKKREEKKVNATRIPRNQWRKNRGGTTNSCVIVPEGEERYVAWKREEWVKKKKVQIHTLYGKKMDNDWSTAIEQGFIACLFTMWLEGWAILEYLENMFIVVWWCVLELNDRVISVGQVKFNNSRYE